MTRGIHVAQRQPGNIQGGIRLGETLEIFLGVLIPARRSRRVADRRKGEAVLRIHCKDFFVDGDGFVGMTHLDEEIAVELQTVGIG